MRAGEGQFERALGASLKDRLDTVNALLLVRALVFRELVLAVERSSDSEMKRHFGAWRSLTHAIDRVMNPVAVRKRRPVRVPVMRAARRAGRTVQA